MANISTYPIATPGAEDLIPGTQTITNEKGKTENVTRNFTVASLKLFPAGVPGSGTVTTVSSSIAGDAFGVAIATPSTTPDLAFTWSGDATQYINGAGDKVLLSTLPSGSGTVQSVGLSIDVDDAISISNSPITNNGTIALNWQGDSAQVVLGSGELGTYFTGTTTATNTQTFTGKSGSNNQWTNDQGYTTNTGTTTATNAQTFTNKGGNISQWTNDSGYLTSFNVGASSGINVTLSAGTPIVSIDYTGVNNLITKAPNATTVPVALDKFLFMVEDQAISANKNAFQISASDIGLAQITKKITSSDLMSVSSGTTIELIPSPGVAKYIKVVDASYYFDPGPNAYTFAKNLTADIGADPIFEIFSGLLSGGSEGVYSQAILTAELKPNASLELVNSGGVSTTTGDGTLDIKIMYQILDTLAF